MSRKAEISLSLCEIESHYSSAHRRVKIEVNEQGDGHLQGKDNDGETTEVDVQDIELIHDIVEAVRKWQEKGK